MPRIRATHLGRGWLPLIDVMLEHTRGKLRMACLLDSGSVDTIIPGELLHVYGIEFRDLPPSPLVGRGAGGTFELRTFAASLRYRHWEFANNLSVAPPGTLAGPPLLGRNDFFKRFNVRFQWHRDPPWFEIEPVSFQRALAP